MKITSDEHECLCDDQDFIKCLEDIVEEELAKLKRIKKRQEGRV